MVALVASVHRPYDSTQLLPTTICTTGYYLQILRTKSKDFSELMTELYLYTSVLPEEL